MGSIEKQYSNYLEEEEDESCVHALQLTLSQVLPMVLNAANELEIFDIIAGAGGPDSDAQISASEIASKLPTQNPDAPAMLDRMLRLLGSYSLLSCSLHTLEDGTVQRRYALSPVGKFFVQNQDGSSLASLVSLGNHRAYAEVTYNLKDAILEGTNQFKKVHGMTVFQYMNIDPTLNKVFNKSMAEISSSVMKKILEVYKGFEGLTSLVDVGGGTGMSLNMIMSMYPSIKGINFDLPHVIQTAASYQGIEHVGGDMLVSIPKGDAIMIKTVFHNWSDDYCMKILNNCYEALPENGKAIVVDIVMPMVPESSNAAKYATQLDNFMLLQLGGRERTEEDFEALCKASKFSNLQIVCCAYAFSVIEFYK
uniref:Putative caffeic acid 3-O-methyltransferase-like n=1 Tax=Davidia involucrata TaxID=16924 RepID=A0A5B7A0Y8_DAVIN